MVHLYNAQQQNDSSQDLGHADETSQELGQEEESSKDIAQKPEVTAPTEEEEEEEEEKVLNITVTKLN
jgi:hypothetical protein